MDSVLISVIVLGAFIILATIVGFLVGNSGKPYGILKLAIHIMLFLFVTAGLMASIYKLQGVNNNKLFSTISLYIVGLTLLLNLIIGITMVIIKNVNPKLVLIHKLSTLLMAISTIASIIFLIQKI